MRARPGLGDDRATSHKKTLACTERRVSMPRWLFRQFSVKT